MDCFLVNILNSVLDACLESIVLLKLIIIISITCISFLALMFVLHRRNILATLPNKTINLNCYFGIIFLVILSIFYNRFAFIPTIIITCYVFLYNQIASQNSFEKNSASCRAQSIIDRLQEKIGSGNNQQSKINSGFEYFDDLLILIKPEIYDVFGTIKQTFKREREKYDVKQQLEVFFCTNKTICNVSFDNADFSKVSTNNIKFKNCCFNYCKFIKSDFSKCSFYGCIFNFTSFYKANLSNALFDVCHIIDSSFWLTRLIDCEFSPNCQFQYIHIKNNKDMFKNALYNVKKLYDNNTNFIQSSSDQFILSNGAKRVEIMPSSNAYKFKTSIFPLIKLDDCVCIDNDLDLQILQNYINTNNEEPILKRKEFKLDNDVDKESIYLLCFDHEEIKKLHPAWYP